MKTIELILRHIAYLGTGWKVGGPTPSGLTGMRARFLHAAIGFCWMAKGGQYDRRTFWQRTIFNQNARWHFHRAIRISLRRSA